MRDISNVAHKGMVPHRDVSSGRNSNSSAQRSFKKTVPTMGPRKKTSYGSVVEADFCEFISEMLQHNNLSKSQADHIARNSWHQSSIKVKASMVRYWKEYAQKERVNWYNVSLNNCLNYIEFVCDKLKHSFSSVVRSQNFVTSLHHFTGKPFTESDRYLLDHYASASFNTNPPKAKRPVVT